MPKQKKEEGRDHEHTLNKKRAQKAYKAYKAKGNNLYVASKVNEMVKTMGLRIGAEAKEVMGKEIYALIWKAAKRSIDNDRKTIHGKDF